MAEAAAPQRRYKVGVIGAGARGEHFARQLYAGTERAELFGVCDIDADRLGKFVDFCELTNARTWTDTAAFLAEPELDAVIITTPDFTHRDVGIMAMRNGKHIYMEKPLAVTAQECRDLIAVRDETGMAAFVGFNMRATIFNRRLKEVVDSGVLGQIVHIDGLEALRVEHGASFFRRFHRYSKASGGILNTKGSHDLDMLLWLVGHQHKVVKVASFAGCDVFTTNKKPADHCRDCPPNIYKNCHYKAIPGFVFPVRHTEAIYSRQEDIYGGDLCVFTEDKDIFDNQTVIFEFDNGIRGNFNMQMFHPTGKRQIRIIGELATLEVKDGTIEVHKTNGEVMNVKPGKASGGHGGSDPVMLELLLDTIEGHGPVDSGLEEGLAATLLAEKALQSVRSGQVMNVGLDEYYPQPAAPVAAGNGVA